MGDKEKKEKPKPPSKLAGGKYELEKRLGAGCFGEVYRGHQADNTKIQVAIKFENASNRGTANLQLEHEADFLKVLAQPFLPQGFVTLYHFGQEGAFDALVMDLLGRSLEDRVQGCKGKFTHETTLLCTEQVLWRIEYLHSKGYVHRDIKPENFMFGRGEKVHHIYIIDFGLSKKYWDSSKQQHAPMRTKLNLTGTARYASINAHRGLEQGRRDDLEAIGHMFFYFLRGALPWSGLDAKTQEEKYRKIKEKKEATPLDDLCEGHPACFKEYLRQCRDMEFRDRPDYNGFRRIFREERNKIGPLEDHAFQWFQKEDKKLDASTLEVLEYPDIKQPDDPKTQDKPGAKQGGGGGGSKGKGFPFCLCGGSKTKED